DQSQNQGKGGHHPDHQLIPSAPYTGWVKVQRAAWVSFKCAPTALDRTSLPPGFLTGLAGIAWSALLRGEVELARSLLDSADGSDLLHAHHSLYHGMAGIGMAHLAMHHATGLPGHLDRALSLARRLADTVHHGERGAYWQDEGGVRIGMGYGQAGVALFLLRLSQLSGDPAWRVLGEQALRHDLSYGFELETGVTTFPSSPEEVNTYEPYLEQGTAGIAKVAIRYGLWQDVNRLVDDFHRKYSGFCGLLYGLSGMLDVFVDAHLYSGDPRYLQMAERPYQGIVDLYLFEEEEGMAAVPGENLFRISFDHGTGIAGVIRALHRYDTLAPDEFFLDALDVHGAVVREVDGAGVGQAAVA
uniref:lanthionine synthetase C family protein n=1 Tax=Stenotrophomonas muris TaxID=2963283 RepID=UPI00300EC614